MAVYAYWAFVKHGIFPSVIDDLETSEKALIIAFIRKYAEDKKKAEKEMKK